MSKFKTSVKGLSKMIRPLRGSLAVSVLIGLVRIAASLGFVWVCKALVDIATGVSAASLGGHIAIMIGIMLVQILASAAASYWESYISVNTLNKLRFDTFSHVLNSTWNGMETFNSGESKKRSRDIMLRTARHEAGHALISWLSGDKPSYITIVSRGDYGGYMQHANQEERTGYTKQELIGRIRTALGGRAAEIVYYGRENGLSTGASGDLETATDLAERMLCRYGMDEEFGLAVIDQAGEPLAGQVQSHINELLKVQLEEAIRLIQAYQDKVSRLVSKLMESNSLREQEIDRILSAE